MKMIDHGDPRILHVSFETQFELCNTMLRLQEFYESPYDEIRGEYFTLDQYMERYAKDPENKGVFDYFERWAGFNIPGDVIVDFSETYSGKLRECEQRLFDTCILPRVEELMFNGYESKIYLIASYKAEDEMRVVEHEKAHAYFYLEHKYCVESLRLSSLMPQEDADKMHDELISMGYTTNVIADEIQAYMTSDTPLELKRQFDISDEALKLKPAYDALFAQFNNKKEKVSLADH